MKLIKFTLGFIAFFGVLGWTGTTDKQEYVYIHMKESTRAKVAERLGKDCTIYEIAEEYINNTVYYDSISRM